MVEKYLDAFECLVVRTEKLTNNFLKECCISGAKEEIKVQVEMNHPSTWLEATQRALRAQFVTYDYSKKPKFSLHPIPHMMDPHKPTPSLKVHKLTWSKMVEHQLKGLCYNYHEKYSPWHQCKEHKLFMAISKEIYNVEVNGRTEEEVTPTTEENSLHG
jgi:hypothetical protein